MFQGFFMCKNPKIVRLRRADMVCDNGFIMTDNLQTIKHININFKQIGNSI